MPPVQYKVLGRGGFGCVVRPATTCAGDVSEHNVTKFFGRRGAFDDEMRQLDVVRRVPGIAQYAIVPLDGEACPVPHHATNDEAVAACNADASVKSVPWAYQISAPYGGSDFFDLYVDGKLAGLDALRALANVARGVALLHEHDVVHGDIMMENVAVDATGTARGQLERFKQQD